MKIVVIGGGITGHLVKLRIPSARVLDWRRVPAAMTRQFGANYLWEPLIGVPCREFRVRTFVDGQVPEEDNVLAYKRKIGKGLDDNWRDQFRPEMSGFDIIEWPTAIQIEYGYLVKWVDPNKRVVHALVEGRGTTILYDVLISTIPLYALMEMVPGPRMTLHYDPIYVHTTPIPPDAPRPHHEWRVNYISDPTVAAYRITDRDDGIRHYESLSSSGLIPAKRITPGKIRPNAYAKEVLSELAHRYQIFCFGRYACWAPEELVHETDRAIRTWVEAHDL